MLVAVVVVVSVVVIVVLIVIVFFGRILCSRGCGCGGCWSLLIVLVVAIVVVVPLWLFEHNLSLISEWVYAREPPRYT